MKSKNWFDDHSGSAKRRSFGSGATTGPARAPSRQQRIAATGDAAKVGAVHRSARLSALEILKRQHVTPVPSRCDQSRPNRILANIVFFFPQAFIPPYSVIEKIPLPPNERESRSRSFKIGDDLGKGILTFNSYKNVKVVRHQQEQAKIPAACRVIAACGFENRRRGGFAAKLINASPVAANRHKINSAETTGKMGGVIELFADRFCRLGLLIGRAIEVNRPYLDAQPNRAMPMGIVHRDDLRVGIALVFRRSFRRKNGAERANYET